MAAGAAQKCALNILSTGVALRLGHGYRGLMVNMLPDNAKLRQRAVEIVAKAAGADRARRPACPRCHGVVDQAGDRALRRGVEPDEARHRVERCHGDLRAALAHDTH